MYCTQCPNFSTTSQAVLNYYVNKKHPGVRAKSTYKCKFCLEEYSGFHALPKHTRSQHGIPIKISNLDNDTLLEDINDTELKEQFNSCKQYLVDSEIEKGRHSVFNFAMSSSISSTRKWIMCTVNSKLQPNSTLHSDLF